jgi:hypothetical protein
MQDRVLMADNSSRDSHAQNQFGNLGAYEKAEFDSFKSYCKAEGFLEETGSEDGDDLTEGICDDGTLL